MYINSYQNAVASSYSKKTEVSEAKNTKAKNSDHTQNRPHETIVSQEEDDSVPVTSEVEGESTPEELAAEKKKQEREDQKKEKEDKRQEKLEEMYAQKISIQKAFRQKKRVSYDGSADMITLASAINVRQVKVLNARLRLAANNIKRSGGDSKEIQAALARIKAVLGKAQLKIKRLNEEELIETKQKAAEREREIERAEKLQQELEKRRKIRSAKEHSDIIESLNGGGVNAQVYIGDTIGSLPPVINQLPQTMPQAPPADISASPLTGTSGMSVTAPASINIVI